MRLKWFLVTFLCVTLLHSAFVVRAQHEDYADEDEENAEKTVEVNEDMIETDDAVPEEPAEPEPIPEEEHAAPPEEEPEVEEVRSEADPPSNDGLNTDVEVDSVPQKSLIGSRKLGNYYYDEDYYSSNYDVDINYDWSK